MKVNSEFATFWKFAAFWLFLWRNRLPLKCQFFKMITRHAENGLKQGDKNEILPGESIFVILISCNGMGKITRKNYVREHSNSILIPAHLEPFQHAYLYPHSVDHLSYPKYTAQIFRTNFSWLFLQNYTCIFGDRSQDMGIS